MTTTFEAYTGQSGQVTARRPHRAIALSNASAFVIARHRHRSAAAGGQLLTGNVAAQHKARALAAASASTVIIKRRHKASATLVPLFAGNVTAKHGPHSAVAAPSTTYVVARRAAHHAIAAQASLIPTVGTVSATRLHSALAAGLEVSQDQVSGRRRHRALASALNSAVVARHYARAIAYAPVPFSGMLLAFAAPSMYMLEGAPDVLALRDTLAMRDQSSADFIHALMDLIQFSDTYSQAAQVLQALADGMALADIAQMILQADLLDSFIASGVLAGTAQITVMLADALALTDSASALSQILAALHDGFYATITINTGADVFTAWVMTPQTKAMRSYSNWAFNSYAVLGGQFIGAGAAGIYRMGGTTDAAAAIRWAIRTGKLDFASMTMKSVPQVYIGATLSGDLLLRVQATTARGQMLEQTYRMTPAVTGEPREHRQKVGRGFRSVYWTFELANDTDGATVEVHEWHAVPVQHTGRPI